jgi:hypothetical protein
VLDIRAADESSLEATHTLRDNKSVHFPIIEAHGCVAFFGNLPHLLFETDENRIGLHLILATEAWRSKGQLIGFVGQMSGMTKEKPFHRHCLFRRGTEGPLEDAGEATQSANGRAAHQDMRARMIRETGLFKLDELKGRHREAINKLADLIKTPLFTDPIFEHPKRLAREPEPKSQEIKQVTAKEALRSAPRKKGTGAPQ